MDISSILGSQTSSIDSLVNQLMELERQPVQQLEARKSDITVLSGMFTDLKAKLGSLKSAATDLTQTGSASPFASKSVVSGNANTVTVTASSTAAAGSYAFLVSSLAKSQRVQSNQQTSSSTALAKTGTFRIQNASIDVTATDSLESIRDKINGASYTAGYGVVATIVDNRLVLQSQNTGTAYRLATADISGTVMADLGIVAGSSTNLASGKTPSASSEALGYTAGKVNDGTTGDANAWRPSEGVGGDWPTDGAYVQIDLGTAQTISRVKWGRDQTGTNTDRVAKDYSIQVSTDGATWTTVKTVTGNTTGSGSNELFAPTTARYVRMNVTATSDDQAPTIDELAVFNDTDMYGANELQAAANASFSVNGVQITRSANTGLTDVIAGLTINLANQTTEPVNVTVSTDTAAITSKVNTLLSAVNELASYVKTKSAVTEDNGTYTRGGLAGYTLYTSLRSDLFSTITEQITGTSGTYKFLSDIGITLNTDTLQFGISDTTAFNNALTSNPSAVEAMFNTASTGLASKLVTMLTPFTETGGYVDDEITGLDDETEDITSRITDLNEQLTFKEQQLRSQYETMQEMVQQLLNEQSYLYSLFSSTTTS